jgi:hypothetical protein
MGPVSIGLAGCMCSSIGQGCYMNFVSACCMSSCSHLFRSHFYCFRSHFYCSFTEFIYLDFFVPQLFHTNFVH